MFIVHSRSLVLLCVLSALSATAGCGTDDDASATRKKKSEATGETPATDDAPEDGPSTGGGSSSGGGEGTTPKWTLLPLQASIGQITSIWGSSASDVWLVGTQDLGRSTLLHYDGTEVDGQSVDAGLRAIWGTAQDDVWAFGGNGEFVRFDGTDWVGVSTFTNGAIHSTWGSSEIWAVGSFRQNGGVRRSTNMTDWSSDSAVALAGNSGELWSVSGAGGSVYVAGEGGIWKWAGDAWHEVPASSSTVSLHAFSGGGAVATGGERVVFVDGLEVIETDAQPELGTGQKLTGLWGTSPEDIWVTGTKGYLAHFDGSRWTTTATGTTKDLFAIWGKSKNDIWAGGTEAVLHYAK